MSSTWNKQPIIAISIIEVDYIFRSWLRRVFKDLKRPQEKETILFCANNLVTTPPKSTLFHGKSKDKN